MNMLPTSELRELARTVGFDLVGFSRAEPIPPAFLMEWLEAGYAADMDWMGERAAERLDVATLLPGAKTVISFVNNYWRDDEQTQGSPIARYARGRDYHSTLRDRMKAFRKTLTARHPGLGTYGSVDSGPLMEKVWAARAGLGYVGKNGCFITEPFGSWVLLATLILDAEVDAYWQGPAADRCGPCRRCLMACPTGALVGNGQVNAGACLSYQTIENRDREVPEAFRFKFDNLIFGCDICQQVCPLNRKPVFAENPRFAPRAVAELGTLELAGLTPAQYESLVSGTALARARYDGLRRNAVYALGVAKQADARYLLEKLCGDSSELVRTAAQWALRQLDP
ncbi:tRNA epoxyqueuosine(34) reductase QueG [Pyxidicoccus xibeiensis]|uniref:tRNA epoxyqueuosine(34) reductase QueG n=1 Tax=Pyxidicoccus xibeiensis TaxID=2906759 RepID=UPI0020A713A2|nr:tRNA epoxyqueuosine(34) reductase QueG [Pyxidicoccus xibeiensis]MCP3144325.1 tRNA epoxyqueuosine(34) reductase QueG [Pyxidicoccus xibeiensis]